MQEAMALNEVIGMSSGSKDWQCWNITKCDNEECSARQENSKCWEIARDLEDYRTALNVCADCLVFLSQHRNTILSEDEIDAILEKKGVCILAEKCREKKE